MRSRLLFSVLSLFFLSLSFLFAFSKPSYAACVAPSNVQAVITIEAQQTLRVSWTNSGDIPTYFEVRVFENGLLKDTITTPNGTTLQITDSANPSSGNNYFYTVYGVGSTCGAAGPSANSNTVYFPQITNATPNPGYDGQTVTITGTNFMPPNQIGATVSWFFGGLIWQYTITSRTNTQITATINGTNPTTPSPDPAGGTLLVEISQTTAGNVPSDFVSYSLTKPPATPTPTSGPCAIVSPKSISGVVYDDLDQDGTRDPFIISQPYERGIPGVRVEMRQDYNPSGPLLDFTTTDIYGRFTLTANVCASPYGFADIVEIDPPGYLSSTPNTISWYTFTPLYASFGDYILPSTPTPTPQESSNWSFPAQVLNPSLTPVPFVLLKLSYSDGNSGNPQPQGDVNGVSCQSSTVGGTYWNYFSHSNCTPPSLTNCAQDTGYCLLQTPNSNISWNHNFYFVRLDDPNFTVLNSYCRWGDNSFGSPYLVPPYTARPSTASSCTAVTLNTGEKAVLRGNTPWGYSAGARGSYAGNVIVVVTSTPTPTPTTPPVTPTNTPTPPPSAPWFQTLGGNAYSTGGITSLLPSGKTFNTNINNLASEGVSYSNSITVGSGTAGKNAASIAFPELLVYTELKSRFDTITPLSGSSLQKSAISPAGSLGNTQVFEVPNATSLTGDWTGFSGNAVVFVNGNLAVDTNVTVNSGSFLGFVVNGNIVIDETVTQVDGFYFATGTLSTGTNGGTDTQLVLNGTFVADSFSLDRNLGSGNSTTPAEAFNYRPDFAFTAPQELRRPYRHFQEVAP